MWKEIQHKIGMDSEEAFHLISGLLTMNKHSHQVYRTSKGNGKEDREKSIDLSLDRTLPTSKAMSQHESSIQNGSNSVIAPTMFAFHSTAMSTISQVEMILNDLKSIGNKSKFSFARTNGKTHS